MARSGESSGMVGASAHHGSQSEPELDLWAQGREGRTSTTVLVGIVSVKVPRPAFRKKLMRNQRSVIPGQVAIVEGHRWKGLSIVETGRY